MIGYTVIHRLLNMMLTSDSHKQAPAATPDSTLFHRLRRGLQRTQAALFTNINELFTRNSSVDQNLLDRLEEHLIMADVGVKATGRMLKALAACAKNKDGGRTGDIKQTFGDRDGIIR